MAGVRRCTASCGWSLLISAIALFLQGGSVFAGTAQWLASPISGDWNTGGNWTAGVSPNGVSDSPTFGNSTVTGVSLSANTQVSSIGFLNNASAFAITAAPAVTLNFTGVGIDNASPKTQNFATAVDGGGNHGTFQFINHATTGNSTNFTNGGATVGGGIFGGYTRFYNDSAAGNGTFTNQGGTVSGGGGGVVQFYDNSSASNGSITNNGATTSGAGGGFTQFFENSSAGSSTLIANGGLSGGYGGEIIFQHNSTGGAARVEIFGNGRLDISQHNSQGVAIGSLEGGGNVFLGSNNLTVGSNNQNTTFSGVIQDGGIASNTGGSLTKSGSGILTLTGRNTYSGGTVLNAGTLVAGSPYALGTGNVVVNGGVLTGNPPPPPNSPYGNNPQAGAGSFTGSVVVGGTVIGGSVSGSTLTIGTTSVSGGGSLGAVAGSTLTLNGGGIVVLNGGNISGGTISTGGTPGSGGGGSGGLTVSGSGTLTLSGSVAVGGLPGVINSGTIGIGGGTTGGTLPPNGTATVNSTVKDLTLNVSAGSTVIYGGLSYTIPCAGQFVIANGQVVKIPDPPPINVYGNYTQTSGGTLLLHIYGKKAGDFEYLNVLGTANLGGTLVLSISGYQPKRTDVLTLVVAQGGISGQFASLIGSTGTILIPAVSFSTNTATLQFAQGSFASYANNSGFTINQTAVAKALDRVAFDPRASDLISFVDGELLGNLSTDFDLIAPEELTSIFEISRSFADVQSGNIENRLAVLRSETSQSATIAVNVRGSSLGESKDDDKKTVLAAKQNRWDLFMEGSGDFVHVNGDLNAAGYGFTTGGVTVGADYRACDHFVAGLMLGYADTGATLNQGGSVDVNSGKVGIYSTIYGDGFYLNTLAAGGFNSYNTSRTGLGGNAQGNASGEEFDGMIGGGYDKQIGSFTFGPIASAQYTYVGINGFDESGSLAPLHFDSQSQESLRSKVGFKFAYNGQLNHGITVTPSLTVAWQHEFLDSRFAIDSRFADGAGNEFTVYGPSLGRDSVLVNAGVNVQWSPRFATYLYYAGELGRTNYQLNSISAGVRVSF